MIRCAHCTARHATAAEVRQCAAYQDYLAAEAAHEARYPHVDFPDGATFARIDETDPARIDWDNANDPDVREALAEAAYRAALASHPDAF